MYDEREDLENFAYGDLINVHAHYKERIVATGIYMGCCPYEIFVKVLTSDGSVQEFDTLYYYLVRLK